MNTDDTGFNSRRHDRSRQNVPTLVPHSDRVAIRNTARFGILRMNRDGLTIRYRILFAQRAVI